MIVTILIGAIGLCYLLLRFAGLFIGLLKLGVPFCFGLFLGVRYDISVIDLLEFLEPLNIVNFLLMQWHWLSPHGLM